MTEIELKSKVLSDRLNQIKAELNERRLAECDKMLTEAGVPEWVMNSDSNGVPGNSVVGSVLIWISGGFWPRECGLTNQTNWPSCTPCQKTKIYPHVSWNP